MPDYTKGKIYKIYSPTKNLMYIGSTTRNIAQRMAEHVSHFKQYKNGKGGFFTAFKILECEDYKIELIENYPCNNSQQLTKKEGEHIKNLDCINKRIEGRTHQEYDKQYYKDNKEQKKAYYKEYYEVNKEEFKQYRETHKEQNKEYRETHKEQNKEYRETNKEVIKEYNKEYYKDNKEVIKEQIKQYREANKERIKEQRKEYREANKERIKEQRKQKKEQKKEQTTETTI